MHLKKYTFFKNLDGDTKEHKLKSIKKIIYIHLHGLRDIFYHRMFEYMYIMHVKGSSTSSYIQYNYNTHLGTMLILMICKFGGQWYANLKVNDMQFFLMRS